MSGQVVKVEVKPAKPNREGVMVQWFDMWLASQDPTQGADRIAARVSDSTPVPTVGDVIVATVDASARSGSYGAYLSVVARSLAVDDSTYSTPADKAA